MDSENANITGMSHELDSEELERLATVVVDAAYHLHRDLGPGLLESVYKLVLAKVLRARGLRVEVELPITFTYEGILFEESFKVDLIVEDALLVELKSVEAIHPVHPKQLLTYLRLMKLPLGLLINFGSPMFRDGIERVVNNHRNTSYSPPRMNAR